MRKILQYSCSCAFALLLVPVFAQAQSSEVDETNSDEVISYGRALNLIGKAKAGSEGIVGYADFEDRPILRVGELVEVIPGMVATQHSGTGKANQYFLRGFNLDHGTDFAAFADGVPVNFRTHGHGQGYLDLNFIIPEITQQVSFRKGPYYADVGDFTAAATASFETYDRLPTNFAEIVVGEDNYIRGVAAASFDTGQGDFLVALETQFNDNPFVLDEDLEKYNGFAKYSARSGQFDWHVSASAYDAEWTSSDQIPLRAVESGRISRLGFIDPDLGGETTRLSLSAGAESERSEFTAYALYYDFDLFSNFTYLAGDPINGDEFEQRDERYVFGASGQHEWPVNFAGQGGVFRVGGDIRYDDIVDLGLYQTAARQRLTTIRDDEVQELSGGAFAEVDFRLSPTLRGSIGLRGDVYDYDVSANLPQNSGSGSDSIVTPTASLAWQAADNVEFYANYGQGFHSNDVRGAAISVDPVSLEAVDTVDVLARAEGAEIGARYETANFNAALVGFWLDLESELVFVGDAGTTEPNDASRRYGAEFNAFWQPADWVNMDVSAAYTDAEIRTAPSSADRIPQSVETVLGAGVNLMPIPDLTASLRLRHFGEAPLIEDGSVSSDPTTVVNTGVYYYLGDVRLGLDIYNLFDSEDSDITYFFESRLPGEAAPIEDIHFKPVEPRQVRASLRLNF